MRDFTSRGVPEAAGVFAEVFALQPRGEENPGWSFNQSLVRS